MTGPERAVAREEPQPGDLVKALDHIDQVHRLLADAALVVGSVAGKSELCRKIQEMLEE